jgi:fatty acid desaturase
MKPKIDSQWLRERCRVDSYRNLLFVLLDHLTLVAVVGGAILFDHWRGAQGLHWLWTAAVWTPSVMAVGAIQHRIGLMGHEASHYLLHPNRKWNDVLADLLCFYPVFGTLAKYRAKHLNHHLYPNDPDKDPNLGGGKMERFYDHFPMAKRTFYVRHYLGFLWPPFVLTNLLDLIRVVMLGGGAAAEADRKRREMRDGSKPRHGATSLGVVYVLLLVGCLRMSNVHDFPLWITLGGGYLVGFAGWALLPASAFFQGASVAVSPRWLALLRLTFYTLLFGAFAFSNRYAGYQIAPAFFILWVLPLVYVFPYFMLVREIFQHANAGTGELDNSRVSHVGPIARWAIMGYGNDYHLIHHIYPNVPCYRLKEVHEHLLDHSPGYRETVIETDGLHHGRRGRISLVDSLAGETGNGAGSSASPSSMRRSPT